MVKQVKKSLGRRRLTASFICLLYPRRDMFTLQNSVILTATLLLTGGCFNVAVETTLKADGSANRKIVLSGTAEYFRENATAFAADPAPVFIPGPPAGVSLEKKDQWESEDKTDYYAETYIFRRLAFAAPVGVNDRLGGNAFAFVETVEFGSKRYFVYVEFWENKTPSPPGAELLFRGVAEVTMPAPVLMSNGDEQEGATVRWFFQSDSAKLAMVAVSALPTPAPGP